MKTKKYPYTVLLSRLIFILLFFAAYDCAAQPSAPTVTSPVNYCKDATASALTATGSSLLWYTSATGGTGNTTAPTPSTSSAATTNYYVTQTDAVSGLESSRALIEVVVNDLPSAPTTASSIDYCQGATASVLSASGTNLKWYTVATGGTSTTTAPTPSTITAATTTHYVSQTNATTGCESPRSSIVVTVFAAPSAPTVTSPINYCIGSSALALTATGTSLLWYTASSGGTGISTAPTPSTLSAGTINYYVSQSNTSTGCESSRSLIEVVVNNLPSTPGVTTPVTYCAGVSSTALIATGTNLKWYTAASGGTGSSTAPIPNTASAGTTNHYVSQTDATIGCESPRSLIAVVVNALPSAPTVTSPVNLCIGGASSALTATGTGLLWYSAATGGTGNTSAPTPSTASVGTTNYYVSQTNATTTCESPRALIAAVVNSLPSAPSVTSPITYCVGVTPTALTATGTSLMWYTSATGGTGTSTAPTPSTASAGTTNYFVSQTNTTTGCEGSRSQIEVTANPAPIAPTVTTPINYCEGVSASALSATGTSLKWYTTATGGVGSSTAIIPSTATVGTTNYYVTQTDATFSCESLRALIAVTVNALPASPTVGAGPIYCAGVTASLLSATGTSLKWYTVATGGTGNATAPTPSTSIAGTTTHYVSQTNVTTGCESPRASIAVVVNALPSAPSVTSPVTYCVGVTPTALTATGTSLKWYTSAIGGTSSSGTPTPSTASAGTTNHYVTQTDATTGCESPRALIAVTVNPLATAPTVNSPVSYCEGATATALTATGTSLLWYTTATGGTGNTAAPIPSTASAGTTNHYVSQTSAAGCGEGPRALIAVVVNALPTAPTVTTPINYCQTATATALTATGTGLKWYTVATGGTGNTTAPTPNTAIVGTTNHYVSQTNTITGCEGARASIEVVVNANPTAPTVTTPVSYCVGASATALTATGTGLLWYTTATGGTGSAGAPTPSTASAGTTNHYVTQTNATTGCESPRALIAVVINSLPTAPTVASPVSYCVGATATALTATGTGLLWYTTATGGAGAATAPTPSTASLGTTDYYVSQTSTSGCGESPRALIQVVVNALPSTPTVTSPVTYCQGATASALTATGTSLKWYTVATGGTGSSTAPSPSTSSSGTTNHYVSQTNTTTGCESSRSLIAVDVNPLPSAPTVTTPLSLCLGTSASALTATGTSLKWYTVAAGGTATSAAPVPGTSSLGTTTYYVSQTNTTTGCESPLSSIDAIVYNPPTAPTVVTPISYCLGVSATALTATGTNLKWYTVATGGAGSSTAPIPSTTAAGTTDHYVSQASSTTGCEGSRTLITVNVNALPSAPTISSPVTYCIGSASTALTATGTGLKWYTTATGGSSSSTAPSPSTATVGTVNYYVSQTDGTTTCESPRALIAVVTNPLPTAPVVTTPVNYCDGATATALTATGSGLLWYTTATGGMGNGTAPIPSTLSVGTTSYYVSQTSTLGCGESPRAMIDVTINSLPSAPTVTSPISYCRLEAATALTATGTALKWYSTAIGGTGSATAPTPNTSIIGTTDYYVSQTNSFGCEGTRTLLTVNVRSLPAAPTVTSPVNHCISATATALIATGTNLKWYTVATGGTGTTTAPTPATATTGTTNYYVSQTNVFGCEGARELIAVTVNPLPSSPVVTTPINLCLSATASALTATGTNLTWYTVPTGGTGTTTAPIPSTATTGTTNHYVTQTDGVTSCESPRALIAVIVNGTPMEPTVTTPLNLCLGTTASAITASGTGLLWYTSATGGTGSSTAPIPSTTALGTTDHYVSQTSVFGCGESPRVLIAAVVNDLPSAPTVTTPISYCLGSAASALTATGTSLKWYTVATGGTSSSTAPTPSTATAGTTNFYVSQTNTTTGCESPRALIASVVNPLPSSPTVTSPVNLCLGGSSSALTATGTGLKWYTTATGGTSSSTAPIPSTATTGTTNHYVSQTDAVTGCESSRALVAVTVNSLPSAPTVTSPINYCQGGSAVALTATGTSLLWYTTATGGSASTTAPTPSTTTVGTTAHYVSQTSTLGCEGARATIDVTINAIPTAPIVTSPLNLCLGVAATALTATGTNLKWYTVATGGTASSLAPSPSSSTIGTTNYYVSQTGTFGCESPRALIAAVVNPLPTVSISSLSPNGFLFCRGLSVAIKANSASAITYQWSFTSTPISGATFDTVLANKTGFWDVTIKDVYGCEGKRSVWVQQDTTKKSILSPSTAIFCEEGSALLTSNPGLTSFTYNWYKDGLPMMPATPKANTKTIVAPGTYVVHVVNEFGCIDTTNVSVATNYPKPIKPKITIAPTGLEIPSIYNYYQWYFNGVLVTGAINYRHLTSAKGNYHVQVTDANGCINYSDTVYVDKPNSIETVIRKDELKIYPNPTRNIVNIESPEQVNVQVTDLTGRQVFIATDVKFVNMLDLADGTYIFRVFDKNNQLITVQKINKMSN